MLEAIKPVQIGTIREERMNRIYYGSTFLTILALLCTGCVSPAKEVGDLSGTGVHRGGARVTHRIERMPNGRLRAIASEAIGPAGAAVRHGPFAIFYDSGAIAVSGEFRAGEPFGEWRSFYPHGGTCCVGSWKARSIGSKWRTETTSFLEMSELKDCPPSLFCAGIRTFGPKGTELRYDQYFYGIAEGQWKFYANSGRLERLQSDEEYLEWNASGSLIHHLRYKDGCLHGTCKSWYPNGQIADMTEFRSGERHGSCIEWDEMGRIRSVAEFDADLPVGIQIKRDYANNRTTILTYDEQGNEVERSELVGGKLVRTVRD